MFSKQRNFPYLPFTCSRHLKAVGNCTPASTNTWTCAYYSSIPKGWRVDLTAMHHNLSQTELHCVRVWRHNLRMECQRWFASLSGSARRLLSNISTDQHYFLCRLLSNMYCTRTSRVIGNNPFSFEWLEGYMTQIHLLVCDISVTRKMPCFPFFLFFFGDCFLTH